MADLERASSSSRYSLDSSSFSQVALPQGSSSDLCRTTLTRHSSDVKPGAYGGSRISRRGRSSSKIPPKPSAPKPKIPPPLPPPAASSPSNEPLYEYVTVASFNSTVPNGIDLTKDQRVKVIEKSPGDWWFVNIDGKEGWAPATYIEKKFSKKAAAEVPKVPSRPKPPHKTRSNETSQIADKFNKMAFKPKPKEAGNQNTIFGQHILKKSNPQVDVAKSKIPIGKKSIVNELTKKSPLVPALSAKSSVIGDHKKPSVPIKPGPAPIRLKPTNKPSPAHKPSRLQDLPNSKPSLPVKRPALPPKLSTKSTTDKEVPGLRKPKPLSKSAFAAFNGNNSSRKQINDQLPRRASPDGQVALRNFNELRSRRSDDVIKSNAPFESFKEEEIYSEVADDVGCTYRVLYDVIDPRHGTALQASAGDSVLLIEAANRDWWFVKVLTSKCSQIGSEGWIPPNYLTKT